MFVRGWIHRYRETGPRSLGPDVFFWAFWCVKNSLLLLSSIVLPMVILPSQYSFWVSTWQWLYIYLKAYWYRHIMHLFLQQSIHANLINTFIHSQQTSLNLFTEWQCGERRWTRRRRALFHPLSPGLPRGRAPVQVDARSSSSTIKLSDWWFKTTFMTSALVVDKESRIDLTIYICVMMSTTHSCMTPCD